jgi:Photoprotection regulator fluorescence recovery protein
MASSPKPGPLGYNAIRDLKWSQAEKVIERKAFDLALHRELEAVIMEAKKRAERIQQPSDFWDLEYHLTECRTQIDRQFDYRYSVLIFVFGDLIRRARLSEQELQGLSEGKLASIRRYAEP